MPRSPSAPEPKSAPRVATKPVPKNRSSTPPALHWTLPYSCANVKWYSTHFTAAQLDGMRRAAGVSLPTADERAQIQACLAGRIR